MFCSSSFKYGQTTLFLKESLHITGKEYKDVKVYIYSL